MEPDARRPTDPWIAALARLYDQQLRGQVASYSNMYGGRSRSAAHLDEFFFRLVEIAEPARFVEIGAYKAEASRRARRTLPRARVVAFEANPHNHARYRGEIADDVPIEYLHMAVADGPTELTFHLRREVAGEQLREVTGNSSLLLRTAEDTTYEKVAVPATSLDAFFADELTVPTCAWVDVEGASGAVLGGGAGFFRSCTVVKIEVEEKPIWRGQWLSLDVLEHFLAEGFQPIARDIEYENQFNVVFARNDFARDPRVLAAAEYQGNYMTHHLHADIDDVDGTWSDGATQQPSAGADQPSAGANQPSVGAARPPAAGEQPPASGRGRLSGLRRRLSGGR
ncbi:FkbM family methyltransferase [Cumulibacter manganitolerans]|uniref:FkbM family methyltransferase n=1 Tax=Cumulibacter manganitolerans TaxID=1884992 RepID=UPI0012951075|nr:FkbM family methyltransferase [Cumulibacter manganitolerans]